MAAPITTIPPFTALPSCATLCGHLYDANGACVPPAASTAAASVYTSCFCNYADLAPFKTGTSGVCDSACTADSGGLSSIQSWFTSMCANVKAVATTTGSSSSSTAGSSGSKSGTSSSSGGGDWLSTHWKWVVMLVIMVVAIAGIWIGACIWRRHYLRKKDRQYALGKTLAATTRSGTNPYGHGGGGGNGSASAQQSQRSIHMPKPGMFMPASISTANVYEEKPKKTKEKKKWVVTERT